MPIISLVSLKGGVGKSTLALGLSAAGPFGKMKCAIVDLDAQGSLLGWKARRDAAGRKGGPDILPPGKDVVATIEAAATSHDLVLIDNPGESTIGARSAVAIAVADLVVVPLRESEFDINSLTDHLYPALGEIGAKVDGGIKVALLPSMVHPSSNKAKVRARFEEGEIPVLEAVAIIRKGLMEFPAEGRTLAEYGKLGAAEKQGAKQAQKDLDLIAKAILKALE